MEALRRGAGGRGGIHAGSPRPRGGPAEGPRSCRCPPPLSHLLTRAHLPGVNLPFLPYDLFFLLKFPFFLLKIPFPSLNFHFSSLIFHFSSLNFPSAHPAGLTLTEVGGTPTRGICFRLQPALKSPKPHRVPSETAPQNPRGLLTPSAPQFYAPTYWEEARPLGTATHLPYP